MYTRRQFIKGLAASAGVAAVPSFLLGSSIVKAQEATATTTPEMGRWRFSGAWWLLTVVLISILLSLIKTGRLSLMVRWM